MINYHFTEKGYETLADIINESFSNVSDNFD